MKTDKLHSVQILRAAAALLVALFHAQAGFSKEFGTGSATQDYLFAFGAVGVHIFFVISGLVMVVTTAKAQFSPGSFIWRRLLRIYPIYWICAAIYVVVYWLLGAPYQLGAGEILGSLLLLPNEASLIIGPGWTLAYEMYFYLVFALFMSLTLLGISFGKALIALAATFLVLMGSRLFFDFGSYTLNLMTNPLLVEFMAGTLIGWLFVRDRIAASAGWAFPAGIAAYGAAIAIGYDNASHVVTMGIGSVLLVLGAVAFEKHHGLAPSFEAFSRFGDGSYALYLIHNVVIYFALRLAAFAEVGSSVSPIVMAFALSPLLVWLGQRLHYRIEIPIMLFLKNRSQTLFAQRVSKTPSAR
jgi:exopolysaccharide production protein ExoZ